MHHSLDQVVQEVNSRTLSLFSIREKINIFGNIAFNRNVKIIDGIVNKVIEERRKSGEDRGDLLSMLMRAQDDENKGMTNQQLRNEVLTAMAAGHETAANILCWIFYLLAQHPEKEKKLRAEIEQVLGGRPAELKDLTQLKYLKMVVEEGLRLYPPGWVIARQTLKDDVVGGFKIDAGSIMQVSPFVTQRLPEFWPDPHTFKPERFDPENKPGAGNKYAYYPFGTGPRVCIGSGFAMMELQFVVACVVQKTKFALVPGQNIRPVTKIVLKPSPTMKMKLEFTS